MNALAEIAAVNETSLCAEGRPLRVLLMTQASGGGVGRHFFDLAAGLTAQGIDVTGIYSPRKLDISCRQRLATANLPPMHAFLMRRAIHPLDLPDYWRLVRLVRSLGPFDVLHGHSSKGGALARLVGRKLGIPTVYSPHSFVTTDPHLPSWQRALYSHLERSFARHTDVIVAVSDDEAQHAASLGIAPQLVTVIPNGIAPPDYAPRDAVRARLGIEPHEFVVGFVGRLTAQKAPEVMVQAFAGAFAGRQNARLIMVGGGPLAAEVDREIARLGIGAQVIRAGDAVGTDFIPAFDTVCLSSRYEGLPYVLIEALAASLPIVSTQVGGATMCIEAEKNGLIVPVDDVPALSAALQRLAREPELRRQYAESSAQLATRFTAQRMTTSIVELYRQVIASRRRACCGPGMPKH